MKEIKTIIKFVGYATTADIFDEDVNRAIKKGYKLIKRKFFPAQSNNHNPVLYAELEREIDNE